MFEFLIFLLLFLLAIVAFVVVDRIWDSRNPILVAKKKAHRLVEMEHEINWISEELAKRQAAYHTLYVEVDLNRVQLPEGDVPESERGIHRR